jgi:uncharacterized membrane protein
VTLQPLRAASVLVEAHAFAAIAALRPGIVRFARPKGSPRHCGLGWGRLVITGAETTLTG